MTPNTKEADKGVVVEVIERPEVILKTDNFQVTVFRNRSVAQYELRTRWGNGSGLGNYYFIFHAHLLDEVLNVLKASKKFSPTNLKETRGK